MIKFEKPEYKISEYNKNNNKTEVKIENYPQ